VKADAGFRLSCLALLLLFSTFFLPDIRVRRTAYSVVAVLDITGSMNTRDVSEGGVAISRIEMEKRAVQDLLATLPCGSKLGVAIFVEERPFLLVAPVETCENFAPLSQMIAGIGWRMGWDSESHIAAGLLAGMALAHAENADLLFMTDGQEMPPLAWSTPPDFSHLRGSVGGAIIGIGGNAFVPIPKFDKTGKLVGVWKPGELPSETGGIFKGREYLTAEDDPHLRSLAASSHLAYLHLVEPADLRAGAMLSARPVSGTLDIRFIPALTALLLLVFANVEGRGWRKRHFPHPVLSRSGQQVHAGDGE
jgi:mxaL protein